MGDALTLSDIHARGVALEWHEAVAVVRAVVEVLLGNSKNAGRLPELHQIQISASGGVDVIGGIIAHDHPIRRLGQLLQATVGQSEPPVQLRLLISQATAPIPAYASIRQYDEAIAYFERPGRSVVLQALHARASLAAVLSRAETVPTLDAIAPLPTLHPPKNARMKASKSTVRAVRLVGIGAVVVLVCGAGVQYLRVAGILPGTSHRASAMASHGLHVFGDAIVNGLSWVTEHVGLGRMVSGDASVVEVPQPGAGSSSTSPKTEKARPVRFEARPVVAPLVSLHRPGSAPR